MTKLSMKTIRFHMITGVCIGMIWMIFSHDRIGVMYFGKLVEMADADELFRYPLHPYTRSLLSAIPEPDPIKEKKRVKSIMTRRFTITVMRTDHLTTK